MQPDRYLRNAVLALAQQRYGTEAEYLWATDPTCGVLRHPNGKWYAVVIDVLSHKLGLPGDRPVDVLNVQVDPMMAGSLRLQAGIFPGYHMNKERWISILLDGTVDLEQTAMLLDVSYAITGAKKASRQKRE